MTEEELKERVRQTPLAERLQQSRTMIGKMCSEHRGPKMSIPVQHYDEDFFISTTIADALGAVRLQAAEPESVAKELELQKYLLTIHHKTLERIKDAIIADGKIRGLPNCDVDGLDSIAYLVEETLGWNRDLVHDRDAFRVELERLGYTEAQLRALVER